MAENEKPIFTLTASQRRLKALVIGLGVLMVLAFMALVVGGILKFVHHGTAPVLPVGAPYQSNLTLAPGESVVSVRLKGSRLLVRLKGPAGEEIVILDAATGREVGRVRAEPKP